MSDQSQPIPEFECPYKKPCMRRELVRLAAAVLVAALTALLTGCVLKMSAPGVSLDWKWDGKAATQPSPF